MAMPADPRDRLAQIPADKLRRMYMPHTIPIPKGDSKVEGKSAPIMNFFMVGMNSKEMLQFMLSCMRRG